MNKKKNKELQELLVNEKNVKAKKTTTETICKLFVDHNVKSTLSWIDENRKRIKMPSAYIKLREL